MAIYKVKLSNREIEIKALKADAERIYRKLKEPLQLNQYFKELTGVIGKSEHETILYSLVTASGVPIREREVYEMRVKAYIDSLPELLTMDNSRPYIAEAKAIFDTHIPIKNNRQSEADVLLRQAEMVAQEAQRQAVKDEWRAEWCKPDKVSIPEGKMAVYLETTYDDSDSQTDYFNRHAQHGEDMLLAIVNKQPEREALARRIMALYPELSKLNWTWETENYSGGHGNYLISDWTEHNADDVKTYGGYDKPAIRFEIRFNSYQREMLAYRNYATESITEPSISETAITTDKPIIRRNSQFNGLEVVFQSKPSHEIIEMLKSNGFRWSQHNGLWYNKYTAELEAQTIALFADKVS